MSSRRSISKFQNTLAEIIYGASLDGGPDEECGSSSDGSGWFGLMKGDLLKLVVDLSVDDEEEGEYAAIADLEAEEIRELAAAKGAILSESTDGSVGITFFESETELLDAWKKIEEEDPDSREAWEGDEEEDEATSPSEDDGEE